MATALAVDAAAVASTDMRPRPHLLTITPRENCPPCGVFRVLLQSGNHPQYFRAHCEGTVRMNHALINIAAWRMVSELHRRYPDKFVVAETHPCDGQYNCLTLFSRSGVKMADFNRPGRFHVFTRDDLFGEPAFRFWFLCREFEPVLCLETTGVVYTRQNASFVLMDLYRVHHRINMLAAQVAGALML